MEDRCSTSWFKFGIKFHFCCSVLWKLHSLCPWTTQTSLGALAREPMVDGFLLMAFRNAEKLDRHLKCTAWLTRPNALLLVGYREELAIHNLWLQKAQRYPERDSYALHVKLEHIRVIGATELEEIQRIKQNPQHPAFWRFCSVAWSGSHQGWPGYDQWIRYP